MTILRLPLVKKMIQVRRKMFAACGIIPDFVGVKATIKELMNPVYKSLDAMPESK